MNFAVADFIDQGLEAGVDVFDAALAFPMPFRRKIDDVFRAELPGFKHEHSARLNVFSKTSCRIGLEVVRKGALELKREAAPHDADTVDRIDDGFYAGSQDVPGPEFDHHLPLSRIPHPIFSVETPSRPLPHKGVHA